MKNIQYINAGAGSGKPQNSERNRANVCIMTNMLM